MDAATADARTGPEGTAVVRLAWPESSGPEVSAAQWPALRAAIADALCDRAIGCGEITAAQRDNCRDITLAESTDMWPFDDDDPLTATRGVSLRAGRVRLDAAQVRRCVESLSELHCNVFSSFVRVASCAGAFVGAVAPGGRCLASWECRERGVCLGLAEGSRAEGCPTPALGTCSAPGILGGPCEFKSDCQDGLHCDSGVCRPEPTLGEPCSTSESCDPSTFCDTGGSRRCESPRSAGSSCGDDPYCIAPLLCLEGRCALRFDQLPEGAACTDGLRPDCAAGQGLTCREGRCQRVGALGAPCQVDALNPCERLLWCDPGTARCAPRPRAGEACSARSNDCVGRSFCLQGRCVQPRALHEACDARSQCQSRVCTGRDASPGVCACARTPPAP